MDGIDRAILRKLQENGRMTATALAVGVGLTLAPCHRRLRELENNGVIRGYGVDVDPAKVDLGFEAIIFVTLRDIKPKVPPLEIEKVPPVKSSMPSGCLVSLISCCA